MASNQPIPITILSGYLGAGKTTLVNHLLRHAAPKKLAILVNEFGELPIDADLIDTEEESIISLSGGCVCCSYGNDLISAVLDVCKLPDRPDHIILEASGVALPGAIARALSLLNSISLDGVVVLADAETVRKRSNDKYMGDTVLRQLADADIVILNKTDLVSEAELDLTNAWLAEHFASAAMVTAQQSVVPLSVVLQDYERQDALGECSTKPHDTSQFSTYRVDVPETVCPDTFARDLIEQTPGLVRAKGFLRDLTGQLQALQVVGARFTLTPHDVDTACSLVVIQVQPS